MEWLPGLLDLVVRVVQISAGQRSRDRGAGFRSGLAFRHGSESLGGHDDGRNAMRPVAWAWVPLEHKGDCT